MALRNNIPSVKAASSSAASLNNSQIVFLLDHAVEGVPRRKSSQCTLHVCIDDRQAVDIGSVDPAEPTGEH